MFLIKVNKVIFNLFVPPPHTHILLSSWELSKDISLMHPGLGLFPAYYVLEEDPKETCSIGGLCTLAHACACTRMCDFGCCLEVSTP